MAEIAARTAGRAILHRIGPLEQEWKGRIDPVTAADRESEQIILTFIRDAFPLDIIVSEESNPIAEENVRGKRRWYVDPLDGTVNFSRNNPHWCVSIAFVDESDTAQAAVVYAPKCNELYGAVRGQGATLNGESIRVSGTDRMDRAVLASGFPYSFDNPDRTNLKEWSMLTPHALTVRCWGAAAKDLCEVARGRIDGFWELELERWDITAGAFICSEAGARVTDLSGKPVAGPSRDIMAANPGLHAAMMELLSR
ncbi:inositol monophosphatase family protein [Gordoniibacillus kamchatkensis]|uniref:inositol monophosphatase family protein n=1 Tax=Gordoniibacillus kamchatkensis TaxID=1590651 RepID=UPI0018CC9462|nr:inositol monophosphatase family protein [Paenibacillus sp. VKM B-2647]